MSKAKTSSDAPPLTILHMVSLMGMGGRCATALRQVRLLSSRGHRVIMGCLENSSAAERCREMGLPVYDGFSFRRGFHPLSFWKDCRLMKSICREHNVDVIHAHLSQESWVVCLGAGRISPRPAVIRSRGVVVPVKPHLFNRWMHNTLTDHLVAPSKVIYDHVSTLPYFDRSRVSLIADGVDTARFSPQNDGAAIREEFKVPTGAPLVVMVARLERVKGHEIFFRALAKLIQQKSIPNLRALCACDERTAGMFDKTVRQARDLGCGEEVLSFTGMRGDVEKILAAADVIALPSLGSEGSSRVALEGGASGKPIVASAVGCLPDVIRDGVTGIIVKPKDPDALAGALKTLLENEALRTKMGRAARERVEKNYDETMMIEQLEKVYRNACK